MVSALVNGVNGGKWFSLVDKVIRPTILEAAWRQIARNKGAAGEAWVTAGGLTLHRDKTRIGDCRQPGQGFEFLGYRFAAGRRLVHKKSLMALKDKVRAKTGRSRGDSLERIIDDLNPMLRGWFGYFKHATPALFGVLDGFVRRRLRAILRKHDKRPGIGRCAADHQRWANAFFAAQGLFTLRAAFEQARHSR
jgi:RNA-directed DNA polymerase